MHMCWWYDSNADLISSQRPCVGSQPLARQRLERKRRQALMVDEAVAAAEEQVLSWLLEATGLDVEAELAQKALEDLAGRAVAAAEEEVLRSLLESCVAKVEMEMEMASNAELLVERHRKEEDRAHLGELEACPMEQRDHAL